MSLKSNYRDGDSFTRRSKKEGYRSRASYKLKELLKTDIKLVKGDSVLDLGSFPGGWSQVASEIVGKFEKKRKALPSISLTANQANLTAIANDFGFEHIFSRQIEAIGKKGDLLIAISTSGNSINIVKAIEAAKSKKMEVIIF